MYDHSSPPPSYPPPPFSLPTFFLALFSPSPPAFPLRTSSWFIISTALLFLFALSPTHLLAAPRTFSRLSRERHHCPLGINCGFSFDVRSSRPLSYFSLFRPTTDVHRSLVSKSTTENELGTRIFPRLVERKKVEAVSSAIFDLRTFVPTTYFRFKI